MPTISQIASTFAALSGSSALAAHSSGRGLALIALVVLAGLLAKYGFPALFPNGIAEARRAWADSRRSDKVTDTLCALADTQPDIALQLLLALNNTPPTAPATSPAGPDGQGQPPDEPSEPPP